MTHRIISADSHVAIRDEEVLARMPEALHERYGQAKLEMFEKMLAGKPQKKAQLPNMGAGAPWQAAGRPGEHDPAARLEDMDVDGVEAEVLYSDISSGATFYEMGDGYLEAFRAFNSAAIDFASLDPKRLLPVYVVPLVDAQEAVAEIERIAAEGAKAVQLPLYPEELDLRPYHDAHYEPIFRTLEETGIPISQHVGASSALYDILVRDPTPAKGIFQSLPPIYMAEVVGSWIITGIFDRHPGLRVVLVESGLGWLPYYIERLDTMKARHGWDTLGMPAKEQPSFYWHRNMAATFEEDRYGIENRHRIGVENLMFATDYPHPDCTWPESQKVVDEHFEGVPDEERDLIIGGNAARIYGL